MCKLSRGASNFRERKIRENLRKNWIVETMIYDDKTFSKNKLTKYALGYIVKVSHGNKSKVVNDIIACFRHSLSEKIYDNNILVYECIFDDKTKMLVDVRKNISYILP